MQAWGLDQPIPIQYCRWMGFCNPETKGTFLGSLPAPAAFIGPTGCPNFLPSALSGATNGVLHGDFGYSINSGEKVSDRIARAALPTFILAGVALVVWLVDRDRPRRVRRRSTATRCSTTAATVFSYVGFAMPTFWLGIMLIFIFAGTLHWLPASGMTDTRASPPFGTDAVLGVLRQQPADGPRATSAST